VAGRWSSGVQRPRSGGHNRLSRWTISLRVAGGGVVSLVLLLMASPARAIQAQVPRQDRTGGWSVARQIPNYNDLLAAPFLVADQNHMVHAFNIELSGDQVYSVMYRRWSLPRDGLHPSTYSCPGYFRLLHLLEAFPGPPGWFIWSAAGGGRAALTTTRGRMSPNRPGPGLVDAEPVARTLEPSNGGDHQQREELVIAYGGGFEGGASTKSIRGWRTHGQVLRSSRPCERKTYGRRDLAGRWRRRTDLAVWTP
jgi:hypothetical protein